MSDKAIYSVDTITSTKDDDKIYVNTGDNIKQVKKSDLLSELNSNLGSFKKVLDDWTPSKTLQLYNYYSSYLVIQSHPSENKYTYVGIVTGTGNFIADIYTTENKPTISVSNHVLTLSIPDTYASHWIVYQL